MKTHFTAADIGKTFVTSQQGVTATLEKFDNTSVPCGFSYSNGARHWLKDDGTLIGYINPKWNVYPDNPIPSEADLLRKEIEELKEQLRTCDRHRAENAWSALGEINIWRDKYNALKASHEADLRTAVEMARGGEYLDESYIEYDYTTDEIIEKILKK